MMRKTAHDIKPNLSLPAASSGPSLGRHVKNWNMFAGDQDYRSNPTLQFVAPFTLRRYKEDKFERLRFHIKAYLFACAMLWTAMWLLVDSVLLACFLSGLAAVVLAYHFTVSRRMRIAGRIVLAVLELCFRLEAFRAWGNVKPEYYAIIFGVPTFVSGIILSHAIIVCRFAAGI